MVTKGADCAGLLARPVASMPLVCSGLALSVVLGRILLFGSSRDLDEGTAAHLFQLFIVAQVPIVATFAFRYLPRAPCAASAVLALQMAAVAIAMSPVAYFGL